MQVQTCIAIPLVLHTTVCCIQVVFVALLYSGKVYYGHFVFSEGIISAWDGNDIYGLRENCGALETLITG